MAATETEKWGFEAVLTRLRGPQMPGTAFGEAINPTPDPLNRPAECEAGHLGDGSPPGGSAVPQGSIGSCPEGRARAITQERVGGLTSRIRLQDVIFCGS